MSVCVGGWWRGEGGGWGGGGGRGEASRQALQVQHQLQRSLIFIYYREIWYGDSHICMEKKKRKCQYQKVSYLITDIPFVDYLQYSIYYLGLKGQRSNYWIIKHGQKTLVIIAFEHTGNNPF